jgi:hypothetical protein
MEILSSKVLMKIVVASQIYAFQFAASGFGLPEIKVAGGHAGDPAVFGIKHRVAKAAVLGGDAAIVKVAYSPVQIGHGLTVQNASSPGHLVGIYTNTTNHVIRFIPVMYGTSTAGKVYGTHALAEQMVSAGSYSLAPGQSQTFYFNGGHTYDLTFAAEAVQELP